MHNFETEFRTILYRKVQNMLSLQLIKVLSAIYGRDFGCLQLLLDLEHIYPIRNYQILQIELSNNKDFVSSIFLTVCRLPSTVSIVTSSRSFLAVFLKPPSHRFIHLALFKVNTKFPWTCFKNFHMTGTGAFDALWRLYFVVGLLHVKVCASIVFCFCWECFRFARKTT